jgi:hypothetical protein
MDNSGHNGDVIIYAISDIHIDFQENFSTFLDCMKMQPVGENALILAGDISDDLAKIRTALSAARDAFAHVFYVPGNHDLWVRNGNYPDSLQKFQVIQDLCRKLDVRTEPARLGIGDNAPAWVVPLFSWYVMPEEGPGGLYREFPGDPGIEMWGDNYFIRWPDLKGHPTAAEYFLSLNESLVAQRYAEPVITFSHFLPRDELMRPENWDLLTPGEQERLRERARLTSRGRPQFNFSRVAGDVGIEVQIRKIHPEIHIYGHQHRNRRRILDGVRYVSNCLGYPEERKNGAVVLPMGMLMEVWDTQAHAAG